MNKKNLIIMNPCSGKKKANKFLTDIVDLFTKDGYMNTVLTTLKQGDGTVYAKEYARDYDLITCIGGDGTFNEVVAGLLENDIDVPIGYIPAGSTNDFASSLNLSSGIVKAAEDIVKGERVPLDIGSFNGRKFSYVASFGAFTQTSYSTPQSVKNMLGHLAYVLEGAASITSIRPEHLKIEADGKIYELILLSLKYSNSPGSISRMISASITSNATDSDATTKWSPVWPKIKGFIAIGSLKTYNSSLIKITKE